MLKYSIGFLIGLCSIHLSFSQAKLRKMPPVINHPANNLFAPFVSFDGDALLFISDNSEDNVLTPFFSSRESGSGWKEPVVLPKIVNTRLNYLYGYSLGPDGKTLYLNSFKQPGVGGFDILVSELKGTSWTEPKNLTVPINSKLNEGCATITPDGKAMFFMRCEKMDQKTADLCKLFMARKKSNGDWEEPVELPASINTGNSQAPRIMADGETLLFSSNKMGGKGGMDLFMTRFKNGQWTKPVPLDFVNTEKDDQYVSATALGRYLLRDSPGTRKNELVEYLIPNELRPKGLMKIDGKVTDPAGAIIPSYISVIDLGTNKRVYNGRPEPSGAFTVYLTEGARYELSIDPEQGNVNFYAKQFDLTSDKIPQVEKVAAILKPIANQDEIPLDLVTFKQNSADVNPASYEDLKRLARVIKSNPAFKFEIQVMLAGYNEDSVRSSADLTEVVYDSIHMLVDDIDTLGQLYKRDTVIAKVTYHNDRTIQQAKNVISYLVSQGAAPNNLVHFGNARAEAIPENRKTVVKAVARK